MQADRRQSEGQQNACNGEDRAISEADARHAPHVTPAGREPAIGRIKRHFAESVARRHERTRPLLGFSFGCHPSSPLGRPPSPKLAQWLGYAPIIGNANSSATDALDTFAIKRSADAEVR